MTSSPKTVTMDMLPIGRTVQPVPNPHFPDALHAVIWRNWDVIDCETLSKVLRGTPQQIEGVAYSMGLPKQRPILPEELRRNYMTVMHRNWHLLPYEQLCGLLGWNAKQMQFELNEDDVMWVKLGGYKPQCPVVHYQQPNAAARARAQEIAQIVQKQMGDDLSAPAEPLFGFIDRFQVSSPKFEASKDSQFQLRMVYPYFLRYGDPLIGEGINDLPESYLAELAACGVNAVWLQAVLNTLAPWDLAPELSEGWEERIANLNLLIQRCRKFGIEVVLYLNEPRAMARSFFDKHPELRGVDETPERAPYSPDIVALCVSAQPVKDFIVNSVRHVFEKAPGLGGVFAITFSEQLTNCYSREYDLSEKEEFALRSSVDENVSFAPKKACPRCAKRGPAAVNAEVCELIDRGMRLAASKGRFILYVWSTPEAWAPEMIQRLPETTWVQCISEWGMPFTRGDYSGKVNEYSISILGPSEQSLRQWKMARERGLKIAAKMQIANTFEVSSIPYIPAMRRVAEHLSNMVDAGVESLMLGWTNGGSPSPNLDLVAQFTRSPKPTVEEALLAVATQRFGKDAAAEVVQAWELLTVGYEEFPFDISVCYNGPQSLGPANLLFAKPTGLPATMVTFPFDDLDGWRGPYSRDTLQNQFEKLTVLWQKGVEFLHLLRQLYPSAAMEAEWRIAEACRIHFQSTANQIRFIRVRELDSKAAGKILQDEIDLSHQLFNLVSQDSRIGFEATNQYGYIRWDLVEKILNCEDLLRGLNS
jgi:hypothetical protein